MNSGRQIVLVAVFVFLIVSITVSGQTLALLSATGTNLSTQTHSITNAALASMAPQTYSTNLIPLIELRDVPVTYALKNIAPEAGINYIVDQETGYGQPDSLGEIKQEPLVNLYNKNVTAAYVFMEICTNNNLTVVRDAQTGVILLRTPDHDVTFVKANIYGAATNIIPLVEFRKMPLSVGLKNLAKQAGIKCILSPKIDTGQPDSEPKVNIRWENITAAKAFAAICESYDLAVTKYPDSGIIRVEPAD